MSLTIDKKAYISYKNFFNFKENRIETGGVETYILALSKVLKELGYKVKIYQVSQQNFKKEFNNFTVYGINCDDKKYSEQKKIIYDCIKLKFNKKQDLLIFGADHFAVNTPFSNSISIQHGVSWDIDTSLLSSGDSWLKKTYEKAKRFKSFVSGYRNFIKVKNTVFVDYNFFNWMMTIPLQRKQNFKVITNFVVPSGLSVAERKKGDKVRIIFARRFVKHRGTRLFSESIKTLLQKHTDLEITFAGRGPEDIYLKEYFKNYKNVYFTEYKNELSANFHKDFDIAVVPSIGSEGTSLSLLEAMSVGCLVVATHVGGMTNIILDNHNGYLAKPSVKDLTEVIDKAILSVANNQHLRLTSNAKMTVQDSFSFINWKKKWIQFINGLEN